MTKIISLKAERDKRIIRKAITMRPVKRVVGHWYGPDAESYVEAVWGGEAAP